MLWEGLFGVPIRMVNYEYKKQNMKMIKKLEYWWRHHVVYPVLRNIFRNNEKKIPIDIKSIQSILILRYDRIGDMIVTTPIFKGLKEAHPHLRIGVFASKVNVEIIQNNNNVDTLYILSSSWWKMWKEIRRARKERYDVVLNLVFNRTTSGGVLANLVAPNGIKVGQGDTKYRFYFNVLLKLTRQSDHMVETLSSIIKMLFNIHLNPDQLIYDIVVDSKTKETLQAYWSRHNLQPRTLSGKKEIPYLVFNLSANDLVRRISAEQALRIGEYLSSKKSYQTLLLHAPKDSIMLKTKQRLIEKTRCLSFPEQGTASLLEIAAIIKGAVAVITPDTSIVHFASAAQTPIIGFYTSIQDVHEWLPFHVKHKIVLSDKNQATSSIPVSRLINEIDEFLIAP
jgi:ADP-heptose:LPS heptosyltransferase